MLDQRLLINKYIKNFRSVFFNNSPRGTLVPQKRYQQKSNSQATELDGPLAIHKCNDDMD